MKNLKIFLLFLISIVLLLSVNLFSQTYKIVDTNQDEFYGNTGSITEPNVGNAFYGQDATYSGNQPSYTDNGNGTITDNITGLMWVKTCDLNGDGIINAEDKLSYTESLAAADTFSLAAYEDWRLPTIKEQYSLIIFSGIDPSGFEGSVDELIPFVDTDYFGFGYGDEDSGERIIDAQMATSTLYVGTTMMGAETMFGVNFADGRIKGYGTGPMPSQTEDKLFYVYFVRGNTNYGINDFEDNQNGTITDNATGLMWTTNDNGVGLIWQDALEYAESATTSGYSDWRLPNAKELQSIIDYSRSPTTTSSAAINPIFNCSTITDEGGESNYPFFWTSTTHSNWTSNNYGTAAVYLCFGEALGFMESMPPGSGDYTLMDVHGAGSQRSDPKTGDPADFPNGNGPQGDVVRIFNYVRLVRDISADINISEILNKQLQIYPNPVDETLNINLQNTDEILNYSIISSTGQIVMSGSWSNQGISAVNVEMLKSGIYFLSIKTSTEVYYNKFVKK